MENTTNNEGKTFEQVRHDNYNALVEYVNNTNALEYSLTEYFDEEELDEDTEIQDIEDALDAHDYFNQEIIYYSRAMDYLMKNDPSLQRSMELAAEYGYYCEHLNSEILASLLASEDSREAWAKVRDDIQDFLDSLEWDYNEDEEEDEELSDEEWQATLKKLAAMRNNNENAED